MKTIQSVFKKKHCSVVIWATTNIAVLSLVAIDVTGQGFAQESKKSPLLVSGEIERDKKLTPSERTDKMYVLIVEETKNPSPKERGLGGGTIDSPYILQQLVIGLGHRGELERLRILRDKADEPRLRDYLTLAIALKGEVKELSTTMKLLDTSDRWEVRALAARALGFLKSESAVPLLEKALYDPFKFEEDVCFMGECGPFYPVRDEAKGSLRRLGVK